MSSKYSGSSDSTAEFKADGVEGNALVLLTIDSGWYIARLAMGGADPSVMATRKNRRKHRVDRDMLVATKT